MARAATRVLQDSRSARAPLRHRPQHRCRGGRPARALARPARAPVLRARARRLERHRLRGPGVPEALPVRDRLRSSTSRAAAGHRLMVRLVKGAYWDSEIKRAQVDGLDGYPVYTRKVYTDVSYLACARRLLAAPDARLSAVRDPQRAHAGGDLHARRRRHDAGDSTSSSACTAWASRSTSRWSGRSTTASSAGRAASTRRSARTRRCSPTWCGACSRTAPTPRSSTASPTRRCRSTSSCEDPVARSSDRRATARRARPAASGDPAAARALRRERAQLARPRPGERRRAGVAGRALRQLRRGWTAAPMLAAPVADARRRDCRRRVSAARAQPVRNPADHATSSATCREATLADVERAVASAARRRGSVGRRRRAQIAPRCSSAPPISLEADMPRLLGLLAREAGKTCRERASPKCARRSTSCATTRRRRARDLDDGDASSARPGGLHQPVEFPARDLHRPGRRRARRGQSGARQAGRADAADRRRGGAPAARRPACRRRALQLLPGRGETVGAALVADARVAGRDVHRLDRGGAPAAEDASPTRLGAHGRAGAADRRDRRPERDDRRLVGARRAGGRRRRRLGVRQRRPALLGAARAVPAGRRRRPHARRC